MAFDSRKFGISPDTVLRDTRTGTAIFKDNIRKPEYLVAIYITMIGSMWFSNWALAYADLIFLIGVIYFWWIMTRDKTLAYKLPMGARFKDKNNMGPGKNGQAEGILYLGNTDDGDEMWFSNSDARTHILYLGTTGSGKTEGLKSMVTNAMAWGSGFVYVDGKADTDLWSSLSSLVRRFGRDDDLLVLNYMTGNSDSGSPSNTMNPFSSGSASYLTNMLTELMPDAEGDNAMWKERAVSLASAMMPCLTWKRDNLDIPLSVRSIREGLALNAVVKLQRDETVPEQLRDGLKGYLDTLPGFVPAAFDDDGNIKPDGGDTTTASQQHGYLAMQFTRALQSLGDDYGYIFDTQAADVDMLDVVLNRRILVVLIPALEKSSDEIANLGKIVAATIKGMMGSTLGSNVEGTGATVIDNKPTHSATPFMTVFDEVGYYTAQGMAVMAAQARSLGFSLVFSGQDLPAMKKRVREEANSITANCNIKIFGKLEDPTETKEFFEKTVGEELVSEASSYKDAGNVLGTFNDSGEASVKTRAVISYDELRSYKEGMAAMTFGGYTCKANMFYSNPGHAKAMRVTRYMALPQPDDATIKNAEVIAAVRDKLVDRDWTALRADVAEETPPEIEVMAEGIQKAKKKKAGPIQMSIAPIVQLYAIDHPLSDEGTEQLADPVAPPKEEAVVTPEKVQEPLQEKPVTPMGFFGKNDSLEDAPKATETKTEMPAPKKELPSEIVQAAKPDVRPAKLPKEITGILAKAGKDAAKKLFRDDDGIDAAE